MPNDKYPHDEIPYSLVFVSYERWAIMRQGGLRSTESISEMTISCLMVDSELDQQLISGEELKNGFRDERLND
jgi:hypothetical protein